MKSGFYPKDKYFIVTYNSNLQINKSNSLQNNITKLAKKIKKYNSETPLHKTLLTSAKDCAFYTGIKSGNLFDSLHDIISPYVRRHWRSAKYNSSKITRKFKKEPKRMGPVRKLGSKDEFLLMLMRLRLRFISYRTASCYDHNLS